MALFFFYISVFSPLIPLTILNGKKKYDGHYQPIILLLEISYISDLISSFLITGTNYIALHIYGLGESLVIFWFFYRVLKSKVLVYYLATLFILFYLLNSSFIELNSFNTIGRSVECITIIILSMKLFYEFFKYEDDILIENSPIFWFNVSFLIYFSGAFFTFIFSKYILDPEKIPLWWLHNTANFGKNVLISIGLWKIKY